MSLTRRTRFVLLGAAILVCAAAIVIREPGRLPELRPPVRPPPSELQAAAEAPGPEHSTRMANEAVPGAPTGAREERPIELVVLVEDEAGTPIRRAACFFAGAGGEFRLVGHTDAAGLGRFAPARDIRTAVSADGYATWTGDLEIRPRPNRIVLQPARRLVVQVLLPNSEPAPAGIRVAAFEPKSPRSDAELADDILRGHPGGHHAATDSAGQARLEGLAPGTELLVTAAGAGFVSRSQTTDRRGGVLVSAEAEAAEVVVECAYGIEILLVDADTQAPIALSPEAWGIPVTTKMLDPATRMCLPGGFECLLLGVTPAEARPTLAHQVQVYASPGCANEVGPLELRSRVPGYRPSDSVLFVPRSLDGPARQVVKLQPTGAGFGEVEVALLAVAGMAGSSPRGSLPAAILTLSRSGEPDLQFALRDLPGKNVVTQVPTGLFQGLVRTREGGVLWPLDGHSSDVSVEEHRPFRIDVPLDTFASLRLDVLTSAGALFPEPMQFSLVRLEGRRTAAVIAAGVETRFVHGLSAGPYELTPIWPSGPHPGLGAAQRISLIPGSQLELRFTAP